MSKSKKIFDLFLNFSDAEIERGIHISENLELFEEERSNPMGNALLIAMHRDLYNLAKLYIECKKDILMTKMSYGID